MDIMRMLVGVSVVAAVAASIPAPVATPGESSSVDIRGFPSGDVVWGTLNPGPDPLGLMQVSSHGSITVYFPVWATSGRDEIDLVDAAGRRGSVSVYVGPGLLPWPITMRLRGAR